MMTASIAWVLSDSFHDQLVTHLIMENIVEGDIEKEIEGSRFDDFISYCLVRMLDTEDIVHVINILGAGCLKHQSLGSERATLRKALGELKASASMNEFMGSVAETTVDV